MGDDYVKKLLVEWEFDWLIPTFAEHEIDEEALLQLDENVVKEIIPVIGKRVKFLAKLRHYQNINGAGLLLVDNMSTDTLTLSPVTEASASSSSSTNLEQCQHTLHEEYNKSKRLYPFLGEENMKRAFRQTYQIDLQHFLKETLPGTYILKQYEKERKLDRKTRNLLTDIIIKEAINDSGRLTHEDFENLSLKICNLFPNEVKSTYYIPYVSKENNFMNKPIGAKGKLIDKYRNLKRVYNYINKSEPETDFDNTPESTELPDSIEWLKNNREPWDEVLRHWRLTYALRKEYVKKTVHEFLQDWPILTTNDGQNLIEEDFNLGNTCSNALLLNWEAYFNNLTHLIKQPDKEANELLKFLDTDLSTDSRTLIQFYILLSLFPPTTRIHSNKRHWKPSVLESRESFIFLVTTASNIHITIDKRKEKLAQYGLTVQPYVLVVGSNVSAVTDAYMVIDDHLYKTTSVLKAVDICFKTFHVLHAEYPKESEHIWLFLQKVVYKINTVWDKKIPALESFISELVLVS